MMRGMCLSPLSSEDEENDAKTSTACARRKAQAKKRELSRKNQLMRPRGGVTKAKLQQQRARSSNQPRPQARAKLAPKPLHVLMEQAPPEFVSFLEKELTESNQSSLVVQCGFGKGWLVREYQQMTDWEQTFAQWMHTLGFKSCICAGRPFFQTTDAQAGAIVRILKKLRRHSLTQSTIPFGNANESLLEADEQTLRELEQVAQSYRRLFNSLDQHRLEILSSSENEQLLALLPHPEVTDAFETALSKPSLKKDRNRARRRTRMDRRSSFGGRLSLIPRNRSSLGGNLEEILIDEQAEWEDEMITKSAKAAALALPESVLSLVLKSGFFTQKELMHKPLLVCKLWRKVSTSTYAWMMADYSTQKPLVSLQEHYVRYPYGSYLSDGAYKEVYKVFSAADQRFEAVSVMDILKMESNGNQHVARQEIAHSIVLSEEVKLGLCRNYIEIYDIFVSRYPPNPLIWGSGEHRKPKPLPLNQLIQENKKNPGEEGIYQFIRMELCDGGDLENFIAFQRDKLLPLHEAVVPFLFQMVFSLYHCRRLYSLRHGDIKLLNFFLKNIESPTQESAVSIEYTVEATRFIVEMPKEFGYLVKLADYGSADTNLDTLGAPVTLDQFTTLENTPMEFLLQGDAATQSHAADAFSLGLAMLHLFTGCAPYEEILATVRCPAELKRGLKTIWQSAKRNSGFSVLRQVLRDDPDDIIYHTLYRYLVLFGLAQENPCPGEASDRVWNTLLKQLAPSRNAVQVRRSRRAKADTPSAREMFERDCALFSIKCGTDPIIQRCRQRLEQLPQAKQLLMQLINFNPHQRPSFKSLLLSELFGSLRKE